MDLFKHELLDTTRQQIRLISITPEPSGQINCQLVHAYLEDEKSPDYRAVSYEWGLPTPLRSVKVNGRSLEVRQNLYAFLEAFRARLLRYQGNSTYEAETQWLWIDQICIDQAVISERNHQVKMMSKIYSRAIYVYVWLGPSQAQVEEAMTVLKSGLRRYFEDRTIETSSKKRKRHRTHETDGECSTGNKPCPRSSSLPIVALRCFFENTYWQRLWIVQEIMLARYIRILCGDTLLSWDELRRFCVSGKSQLPAIAQGCISLQMIWLAEHALSAKVYTYTNLLATFSKSQCHDQKDKVYGLQGLIPPRMRVTVDYSQSVLNVFRDGVCLMCEDDMTAINPEIARSLERLEYGKPTETFLQACSILRADVESIVRMPLATAIVELGNQMGLRLRQSYLAYIGQKNLRQIDAVWLEIVEFYTKQRLPALYSRGGFENNGRVSLVEASDRDANDLTANLFATYEKLEYYNDYLIKEFRRDEVRRS